MPETAKKAASPRAAKPAADAPPEHASIHAALVAFMGEKPQVVKNQTATIPGRDGRTGYSYKYADLADVDDAATPVLAKHGLAFISIPKRTENGAYELVGTLIHGSTGGVLEGQLPLHGRTAQELGSSLTYMRRYILTAMTGIVADEDDDGSRAEAARQQRAESEPPPEGQPQAVPPHVQRVRAILESTTAEERAVIGPWWDKAVAAKQLPPRTHLTDMTSGQVDWVAETLESIRDRAEQERQRTAQEAQGAAEGDAGPDPQ